jgi:hypothetical protein
MDDSLGGAEKLGLDSNSPGVTEGLLVAVAVLPLNIAHANILGR